MIHTDSKNLAFAYAGDAKSIIDICKAAGYTVKLINGCEQSDILFVTGIDADNNVMLANTLLLVNDSFTHIKYAKLELALQDKLSSLKRICDKCSRTALLNDQKKLTPIYRFKNNAVYAKEIGVEPWEHMLFTGEYVVCFIWDTRQVTKVLSIDECKLLSKRMLVEANDNNADLVWPQLIAVEDEPGFEYAQNCINAWHAYYTKLEPSKHPMMTGASSSDAMLAAISKSVHEN